MRAWGRTFAKKLQAGDVVMLTGELGAGKTTLVQGIASGWGFKGAVQSPTFALANEYASKRGPLYHLDMYRLSAAEAIDFPLEDYVGSGICLIEWADRISERWPPRTIQIHLQTLDPKTRKLTCRGI